MDWTPKAPALCASETSVICCWSNSWTKPQISAGREKDQEKMTHIYSIQNIYTPVKLTTIDNPKTSKNYIKNHRTIHEHSLLTAPSARTIGDAIPPNPYWVRLRMHHHAPRPLSGTGGQPTPSLKAEHSGAHSNYKWPCSILNGHVSHYQRAECILSLDIQTWIKHQTY